MKALPRLSQEATAPIQDGALSDCSVGSPGLWSTPRGDPMEESDSPGLPLPTLETSGRVVLIFVKSKTSDAQDGFVRALAARLLMIWVKSPVTA